jgi:hypothetical protein
VYGLGTYIAASYVKWIEAAGGRVVPLIAGSNQNFTQVCTLHKYERICQIRIQIGKYVQVLCM